MKPAQLALPLSAPEPPPVIVTNGHEEFLALCARHDCGELRMWQIARGKTNGQWVCHVYYPEAGEKFVNKSGLKS